MMPACIGLSLAKSLTLNTRQSSGAVRCRYACGSCTGQVNGIPVRRFRVKRERDPRVFARRSDRVFENRHSLGDELHWLDAEGPTSPALVGYIGRHASELLRRADNEDGQTRGHGRQESKVTIKLMRV